MSMTREEIIKQYEMAVEGGELVAPLMGEDAKEIYEMLKAGLSALRPITREQVEKMRGEWTTDGVCSRCGFDAMYYKGVPVQVRTNYCPACGSPMTDKAVDMVMERLEALHSETKTD